jgi:hypothetical protein
VCLPFEFLVQLTQVSMRFTDCILASGKVCRRRDHAIGPVDSV